MKPPAIHICLLGQIPGGTYLSNFIIRLKMKQTKEISGFEGFICKRMELRRRKDGLKFQ